MAERRIRRGRPNHSEQSGARQLSGQIVAAGGPLRAEGIPKRRCQFESIAAERRI